MITEGVYFRIWKKGQPPSSPNQVLCNAQHLITVSTTPSQAFRCVVADTLIEVGPHLQGIVLRARPKLVASCWELSRPQATSRVDRRMVCLAVRKINLDETVPLSTCGNA